MTSGKKTGLAGLLLLAAMLAGIFSVAPAIDSTHYLAEAAGHGTAVVLAAAFQLAMSFAGLGAAILLYAFIRASGSSLAKGFLCFRVVAASLSITGTVLLLALLELSRQYGQYPSLYTSPAVLGSVLKAARDQINHVFMVLALCSGNLMFYFLLYRWGAAPRWLSVWGIAGSVMAMSASVLVLFGKVDIISSAYLSLNAPVAIQEVILGFWLMVKGWGRR